MRQLHRQWCGTAPLVLVLCLGLGADTSLAEETPAGVETPQEVAQQQDSPPQVEASSPDPTGGATSNANAGPEAVKPPAREVCHDDEDNDGDGLIDCDDVADCLAFATCGWILGGWVWIWTIFGVTLAALILYAWFITARLRRARSEETPHND
ncbi:MAG TPA: hypothetical protein DIU15_01835 [Deltaproteobacteria bacterium]|nr:hypothetical protein [Deltaproteobacteria bacterium]